MFSADHNLIATSKSANKFECSVKEVPKKFSVRGFYVGITVQIPLFNVADNIIFMSVFVIE